MRQKRVNFIEGKFKDPSIVDSILKEEGIKGVSIEDLILVIAAANSIESKKAEYQGINCLFTGKFFDWEKGVWNKKERIKLKDLKKIVNFLKTINWLYPTSPIDPKTAEDLEVLTILMERLKKEDLTEKKRSVNKKAKTPQEQSKRSTNRIMAYLCAFLQSKFHNVPKDLTKSKQNTSLTKASRVTCLLLEPLLGIKTSPKAVNDAYHRIIPFEERSVLAN